MELRRDGGPFIRAADLIKGYYVGGKTGTAQIWDPNLNGGKGGWKVNDYNYSFYGWVGHSQPDLVIGVVIFEGTPTVIKQGVLDMPVQSYELFRRIATDAVTTEQIPPNPDGPAAARDQGSDRRRGDGRVRRRARLAVRHWRGDRCPSSGVPARGGAAPPDRRRDRSRHRRPADARL